MNISELCCTSEVGGLYTDRKKWGEGPPNDSEREVKERKRDGKMMYLHVNF